MQRQPPLDRLSKLNTRLRNATLEEVPDIQREMKEARDAMRRETAELDRMAQEFVQRSQTIQRDLLDEIAALQRMGERLPDAEAAELRGRCETMRRLVHELR